MRMSPLLVFVLFLSFALGCADPIALGPDGAGGIPGSGGSAGSMDGGAGGVGGAAGMGGSDAGMDCNETGCDDGNQCTVDGACNTLTGTCSDGTLQPEDTPCTQAGGFFCDGQGACVVCNRDDQCARFFPPDECREPAACVDDQCPFPAALPDGAPCSRGECYRGDCLAFAPRSKRVPMVCDNSNSEGYWEIPIELTVAPTAIEATREFEADIAAKLFVPQDFLQFALDQVYPDTLTSLEIVTARAEIVADPVLEGSPVSTRLVTAPITAPIPQVPDSSNPLGPNVATDDIVVPLAPIFNRTYRAAASSPVCFDAGGANPPSTIGAPPVRTGIRAVASNGAFVRFECVGGTLDDNGTPSNPFDDSIQPNVPAAQVCFPVEMPAEDLCLGPPPVDCSSDQQCVRDATCDPYTAECVLGTSLPRGTPCDQDGGSACDGAGVCVECLDDSGCPDDGNQCTASPSCIDGSCTPPSDLPEGTVCTQDGGNRCDGDGNCIFVGDGPLPRTANLTIACTSNLVPDVTLVPFELTVSPSALTGGQTFTADCTGAGEVSEALLDAVQLAIPGGVSRVDLVEVAASVHVRSGAAGDDLRLTMESAPFECAIDGASCDPSNDEPSVPGRRGNADCVPVGPANPCGRFMEIPTSDDCAAGGLCAGLDGGGGTKLAQCAANGFCVIGPLDVPLASQVGTYVADPSGVTLFGWDDASTGAMLNSDGTWDLPPAVFTVPIASNGVRAGIDQLSVALECTMGVDSGGPSGVGVPDGASPTPDELLIAFPIPEP